MASTVSKQGGCIHFPNIGGIPASLVVLEFSMTWYSSFMDFIDILKPGLDAQITETVTDKNIASHWGSGGLDVYATPAMIALMEMASYSATAPLLPPGWSTVGTVINIKHISATPPGMKVTARAELLSIEGRELSFRVEAFDDAGKIGEGLHGRFIVENEKFLARTERKKL